MNKRDLFHYALLAAIIGGVITYRYAAEQQLNIQAEYTIESRSCTEAKCVVTLSSQSENAEPEIKIDESVLQEEGVSFSEGTKLKIEAVSTYKRVSDKTKLFDRMLIYKINGQDMKIKVVPFNLDFFPKE